MEKCNAIIQSLLKHLDSGFSCSEEGPYLVLITPFEYSDGDYIYLYIEENNKGLTISDMGETYRKLASYSFNWRPDKARSLFSSILRKTGVSSHQGKIYTRLGKVETYGESVLNLIQAIQQTNNLLFITKEYSPQDFQDKVEKEFINRGFKPILNHLITGDSGKDWRVPIFLNHTANLISKAIPLGEKGGSQTIINTTYTAYTDIKLAHPEIRRTIIVDDSSLRMKECDNIKLLSQVCDVEIGYWTKKDRYFDLVGSYIDR